MPLASLALPDLVPVGLSVTAVSGKTLTVVNTVTNLGTVTASGTWYDYYYVSSNAVWDAGDYQPYLANSVISTPVSGGSSYRRTNTVTLPSWAGGSHYLILRTDNNDGLIELAETENTLVVPLAAVGADLLAANLAWSGTPVAGQSLTVFWTVTNLSSAAVQPTWYGAIYYSTNAVFDGQDTQLRSQSHSLALTAGGNYQVTNAVTIPAKAPPDYYLILKTDDQNAVFEGNKTNNWRAFGVGQYRDSVGDGIPDAWRARYFGGDGTTTNSQSSSAADPDGDGMPNLFEYLADTNPTNALSVLRLSRIVPETNGVRLEWQGGVAAKQFLERSRSLSFAENNWLTLFTNNPPTPLQTNLFDLFGTNRALFYRIRAVREWMRMVEGSWLRVEDPQ